MISSAFGKLHSAIDTATTDIPLLGSSSSSSLPNIPHPSLDAIPLPLTKYEPDLKMDEPHHFLPDRLINKDNILNIGSKIASTVQEPLNIGSTIVSKVKEPLNLGSTIVSVVQEPLNLGSTIVSKVQEPLSYVASKVQESLMENLDRILPKKAAVEKQCMAHWKTLAPNVEDYSGVAARLIAAGSGKLIKGVLWCGDVAIDGLVWGNGFVKPRLTKTEKQREVSSVTLKKLERVKNMAKMMEKVANDILFGIIKVFVFLWSLVLTSKAGKKLFGLPFGEMVLATFDGFNRVFDAVDIAGRNVMKTSSTIITDIVDHKYGAKTAHATNEGLGTAGYALGTAWTVVKIIPTLNPKSAMSAKTAIDLEIRGFQKTLKATWHALQAAWKVFKITQALDPRNGLNPSALVNITTEDLEIPGLSPLKTFTGVH